MLLVGKNTSNQWKGRAADSKGQSCIRVVRCLAHSCAYVLPCLCVQVSSHEGTDTEARTNQPPCSRCVQALLLLRIKHFSEKEAYSTPRYSFFPSLYVPKFYRFLSSHKTVNSTRVSTTRITNHLYSMRRRRTEIKRTPNVIFIEDRNVFIFYACYVDAIFFPHESHACVAWCSLRRDYSTVDNRFFRGNNKNKKKKTNKQTFYARCFLTFWCNQCEISFYLETSSLLFASKYYISKELDKKATLDWNQSMIRYQSHLFFTQITDIENSLLVLVT